MDDRAAVDRLKRGDVGGLEALVGRYHSRAARAAYLVVRDRALAEDVAQSAFVRAYERIGGFDANRPFGPWFMKVVLNEATAVARRRERFASREVRGAEEVLARLADPGAGPHGLAEAEEAWRRVWRALEELPPVQRAAIVQRYYLGLSEAEMSERSEPPPGTIKRRLHDARRGLSKLLRPQSRAAGAPVPPEAPRRSGRNSAPRRKEAIVADRSKRHPERVLRECAESGVPGTAAPWPAIRDRLVGRGTDEARASGARTGEGSAAEAPRARRAPYSFRIAPSVGPWRSFRC